MDRAGLFKPPFSESRRFRGAAASKIAPEPATQSDRPRPTKEPMRYLLQTPILYLEGVIDRTKKKVEHAQFVLSIYAILVVGVFGGLFKLLEHPNISRLALMVVGMLAFVKLFNAAVGKNGTDGIAFAWSMRLQHTYPRWRWLIGAVLNSAVVYVWPPIASVYVLFAILYCLTALVEDRGC